jgi:type I restriction enzyme M protein
MPVEILIPYNGRVYDFCCGSGGMFIQSERSLEDHSDLRPALA